MIEMIAGVYGLPVEENGKIRIVGMGPKSGPFSIDPVREAELVAKKIARYVEQPAEDEQTENAEDEAEETAVDPIGFDETPPAEFGDDEAELVTDIAPLSVLSVKELRDIGKQYGLTFKVGMTKEEMASAIENAQAEAAEVEDGEPAPVFDAAEAVQ